MNVVDFAVQATAAVGLFYGLWQSGNTRLRGPLACFIAEAATTLVGIKHPEAWSMIVIGGVLFIVQLRNFLKWKKEGKAW